MKVFFKKVKAPTWLISFLLASSTTIQDIESYNLPNCSSGTSRLHWLWQVTNLLLKGHSITTETR